MLLPVGLSTGVRRRGPERLVSGVCAPLDGATHEEVDVSAGAACT
ncbi:MAG: hypothetical protein AVDCRST_MAG32-1372 [uncultured Nocardioides sp.]|uniref:Uncharacterized protein n=1 Tax=uncultured Nocardioides sp. TaxID=198441 RepID=A0A6J4N6F5_9ACTN|nr:MAG: hypothetical protein AVDCRST_MAG32-1372 [uncultured Nocardioides sp.]